MTYIAVPIAADNIGSAAEQINHAKSAGAQILELRTDYLAEPGPGTLKALLGCARAAGLPLIVTCRDPNQGGKGNLPLDLRTEILAEAILAGADYVDCEYDNYQNPKVRRRLDDALSQNPQIQHGPTDALSQDPQIQHGPTGALSQNPQIQHGPTDALSQDSQSQRGPTGALSQDPQVQHGPTGALSQNPRSRLILSAHNFDGPWPQGKLAKLYEAILTIRPDAIPKLVYRAQHINDSFAAFDLLNEKEGDAIALCMGPAGVISRVLAPKLSGFLTFASVDEESGTAPGQPTIADLRGLYRFDDIGPDTEIFGVIGSPVGHSLSPAIFNASFRAAGLNAVYLPILIEGGGRQFADFMDNIANRPWLGFGGFSVTIPHKPHA
ncbi:MAG: type I 3-dehydroquinate dehydratase, partial [Planctomycetes bacterium]|nr:type I 3-dehydroquinate dehydratase [Planctomycetota bacterium]